MSVRLTAFPKCSSSEGAVDHDLALAGDQPDAGDAVGLAPARAVEEGSSSRILAASLPMLGKGAQAAAPHAGGRCPRRPSVCAVCWAPSRSSFWDYTKTVFRQRVSVLTLRASVVDVR